MKKLGFFPLVLAMIAHPASAAPDWTYNRDAAYYGMSTARNHGLCANYTGATHAICKGAKYAMQNACADLDETYEGDLAPRQVCLGIRQAHKKARCSDVPGAGADVCYAYATSITTEHTCGILSQRQTVMCNAFLEVWAEPEENEDDED